MECLPKEINEKGIYVLRRIANSKPTTELIEYDQTLFDITGYQNILTILENKTYSLEFKIVEVSKFIVFLQKNHPNLLKYRNFCGKNGLTSSYIRNPDVAETTKFSIKKSELLDYHHIEFDSEKNSSYILENWIYDIFHAYLYEQTYWHIKNNKEIKLYSHCQYGFHKQVFVINDFLSVSILSNFGYGSASYLNAAIEYKSVLLINYSDYVKYRNLSSRYMTDNTVAYPIQSASWELAFNLVNEIYQAYIEDDFRKYIEKIRMECEILVNTLNLYLKSNSFQFYKNICNANFGAYTKVYSFQGDELTKFRGEKISGALGFIDSLRVLNLIIPTHQYIKGIEDCASEVLKELEYSMVNFYNTHNEAVIKEDFKLYSFEKAMKEYIEVIKTYFK